MAFPFKQLALALRTIAPLLVLIVPGGSKLGPYVPLLLDGIEEAEGLGVPGADKKAHVLAIVDDAARAAELAKPGKVNVAEINKAASAAIDAIIAVLKVIETANPPDAVVS